MDYPVYGAFFYYYTSFYAFLFLKSSVLGSPVHGAGPPTMALRPPAGGAWSSVGRCSVAAFSRQGGS